MARAQINVTVDEGSILRAEERIRMVFQEIEESAVRFVLDGLGVETLNEAHRLIEKGRALDESVAFGPPNLGYPA